MSATGEIPSSTHICLSSDTSAHIFNNNRRGNFTNLLPRALTNREHKKFYIRLHAIALSNHLFYFGHVKVHIYEVEGQRQGRKFSHCIGGFHYPPPDVAGTQANAAGLHTFEKTTFLPLRFQHLDKLQVKLTKVDEEVEFDPKSGPSTLVWVQVTDEMQEREEFLITNSSIHPNTFPSNTLNRFNSPLPSELMLADYEVALLNILYPPDLKEQEEKGTLQINDTIFKFNLPGYKNTRQFVQSIRRAIEESPFNGIFYFGTGGPEDGPYQGHLYMTVLPDAPIPDDQKITVSVNTPFQRACGQTHPPFETMEMTKKGIKHFFQGKPDLHLALPHPYAMVRCDIIEDNIVCGRRDKLLQLASVLKSSGYLNLMYEPRQLTFHPVMPNPFTSIGFSFQSPTDNSKERNFIRKLPTDDIYITLLFRPRKTGK